MNRNNKVGFTLVELLAVIVILAITLVIAVPKVMSVIEDSKKATLESTAKMIASSAEKQKVQNTVLGNTNEITCDSVAKINKGDYASCSVEFDNNTAKVTIEGKGKFEGLYVCSGTKTESTAINESCGLRTLNVNLDGGTDTVDYNSKYEAGSEVTLTEPTKEGYTFNGWTVTGTGASINENKLIMGTENTTITATWEKINYFAEHDWSTIVASVQSGNYSYEVGDTKTIDLGDDLGEHTIRVANTTPCDGTLASQTACGFVLEFADIITAYNMNPVGEYNGTQYDYGTNLGGWPASAMRTYVNGEIYNAIPEELRTGIIDTTVVSSHGSNTTAGNLENENAGVLESSNYWSNDKLYLLSPQEVYGTSFTSQYDSSNGTSRQLDYYANNNVSKSNYSGAIKKKGESARWWWLRSANSTIDYSFYYVYDIGDCSASTATYSGGVAPAFRIG